MHHLRETLAFILLIALVIYCSVSFLDIARDKTVGLDRMSTDFAQVNDIVAPSSNMSLYTVGLDTGKAMNFYYFFRYTIAPRHLSLDSMQYDTTMIVCAKEPSAEQRAFISHNRTLLWQMQTSNMLLLLTCTKK